MAPLNRDARIVLRDAGVTPAIWARANYMADGTWSGDACGCPDERCMNGFHHFPGDECGCLRTLLASYVSGEGAFAGESGYVIRDPLRAQVRQAWRRAGLHSGKPPSELCRFAAALDAVLKMAGEMTGDTAASLALGQERALVRAACAVRFREAITRELAGEGSHPQDTPPA